MDFYLRAAVLFALFVAARAQPESQSRPISFPTQMSTAYCDCITIQSKLDQSEQRISKMFGQLQNDYSTEMNQLEHRVSEMLNTLKHSLSTTLERLEHRVTHLSQQFENSLSADSLSSVSPLLDQLQGKVILIDKDQTTQLNLMEQCVLQMFEQLQNKTESTSNSPLAELNNPIENIKDQENFEPCIVANISASESFRPIVGGIRAPYVDTQFGSGWIIIFENNENANFWKFWHEYRNGFGNPNDTTGSGFWIGLENLHQLTHNTSHELIVEMTDLKDDTRYIRYDRFRIGDESQRYPILELGRQSGTAGDGLSPHLNYGFSSYNDGSGSGCSKLYGNGGWWYYKGGSCYESSLTGIAGESGYSGAVWGNFKPEERWTSLKSAVMMIRAI